MTKNPTKIFPCDCMGEGLVVTVEKNVDLKDYDRSPFIDIAFWEYTSKNGEGNQLTKWERIKYAWHILKGNSPWADMITMNAKVARNFAHHILYLISKNENKDSKQKPIFEDQGNDVP